MFYSKAKTVFYEKVSLMLNTRDKYENTNLSKTVKCFLKVHLFIYLFIHLNKTYKRINWDKMLVARK